MRYHILSMALAVSSLIGSSAFAADGKLGVVLVDRDGKVYITEVVRGSGAESVGIQPGDILDKVGTKKIYSIQDALDAKAAASNNTDVPFIIGTPNGPWDINARFEAGQPYGKYSAPRSRPTASRPGSGSSNPTRPGNPPRP